MELNSFEHVLIVANDLEATKDFYVDIVGLSVGKRPDFPFPGYWLYLGDTPCVHLRGHAYGVRKATGRRSEDRGTGSIDHVAFNATGINAARDRFDSAGIDYEHRLVPGAPLQQMFITDPNGVKIEINFPV
ncbi:MAG TPA: VOC family protein [Afifellaceae bacterium]|nr:VOC family protein [Afifellaceae bacterium]